MQRKLFFTLFVWLILFGTLEAGIRAYHAVTGVDGQNERRRLFVPNPFLVYAANPIHPDHNEQGFRGHQVYAREHDTLRIVCLGGSSTYGSQVPLEQSYPRRLEEELRDTPGGVEVVNAGLHAYSTANLVAQLALRAVHLEPEIALFYVGYNDIGERLLYTGFKSDYSHAYKPWEEPSVPLWRKSRLLDRLTTRLGLAKWTDPHFQSITFHPHSGDARENWLRSSSRPFRANLNSLIALSRAHDIEPVFITQATDFENHPLRQKHALKNDLFAASIEEYTGILREIASAQDVLLIDARKAMVNRADYFKDSIHMNAVGNAERARIIADALRAAGLIPKGA